ncbi:MAG: putative copper-exporting P-type ATPase B [Parcubacteria group bacterium Gr01-1014_20]|nr:MAG: putative copper-exporting P-type ATPase B [Parcubacteria group bacterium Gr01-1014_20]
MKDHSCCEDGKNLKNQEPTDIVGGVSYTCPMHPEIQQDQPGMCPECGMALVSQKSKVNSRKSEHGEHDKHAGHSTEQFLKKFWVSLVLSVPVVLYSDFASQILKIEAPEFPGSRYLPFILGSFVFFYAGMIFLASAWREIRAKLPGMMTLISLAITAAYLYSVFVTIRGEGETLFWELTTLVTIMLLGHWIEMRAVKGAQGALKELSKLLPDTAEVIRGGEQKIVPLSELKEGDVVFVRPGGRIPADGIVIEGKSETNESMITGESALVPKKENSEVIAGTVNGDGSLKIKVTKVGDHTFLSGVMRLVREAQASKSKLQILSDKAAYYLTVVAIASGGLSFILWLLAKAGFDFALERLVAVLVIACPHALGLAVPLVASISTTMAARNGFLVKNRLALEMARSIDVVLFDKTGTLTKGEYGVTDVWLSKSKSENDLIQIAAAVDFHSEHPISKAIVAEAKKRNLKIDSVADFKRLPGKGGEAKLDGRRILVGGHAILENNFNLSSDIKSKTEIEADKGKTIIYVLENNELLGVLGLADVIREESREAIQALKAMNVNVAMITGDSEKVAEWVAKDLGIDEYFARVLPGEKSEKVKLLQSKGSKVAMVGDGINDAPALVQADLGVAIGAGTNVAIESAGIILMKNDPRDIVKIIRLSRLTYTKMIQNLFWATGYNIIAIPLAAGALWNQGITLAPAFAAVLMSLSTVIVSVNAAFLRKRSL